MGAIRVHEFMSMDGVIDTPTWTMDFGFDPKMGQAIAKVMTGCDGILLGRKTYEMFEPAWSARTSEEDPGAPFMNDTTKYIVSSTLEKATWSNSIILGSYDRGAIQRIKDSRHGIYVSGSGTLVRALIADGLVDELHLFVYPLTRGSGPYLFAKDTPPGKWDLASCETFDNGVLYLGYRRAPSSAFEA
ncbi:MAG TPA: dihydrofolate reductase family protein [Acidimicrobiales bacterium]|nr:dihydrofolate reductase family protein [Acidimicrobiales bacterium]